jgi:alkanesulfonate monooxygenase SsuD/methylene tetrahydromethanopterin reductase-like flavin-dependent oxidoreductase (luciferase family)
MDFAIVFANNGPFSKPEGALEFARAAEESGFESLWTVEHVVVPAGYVSTYPYDPRQNARQRLCADSRSPDPAGLPG